MDRKRAQSARKGDYEEDIGRMDGQQFLEGGRNASHTKQPKKADKFLHKFQSSIDTQIQSLHATSAAAEEDHLGSEDNEFLHMFGGIHSKVLAGSTNNEARQDSSDDISDQSMPLRLQDKTRIIIADALELVKHFEEAKRKLATQTLSRDLESEWNEDIRKMRAIIDLGHQVGKDKVAKIVFGIEGPPAVTQTENVSDLLYGRCKEAAGTGTLGEIAQKQEKALRRLTRTLPRE